MEKRLLYRELNGAYGIGSNASLYGASSWVENLDIVAELAGHDGCVNALCWSRDGELLASGSDDTQVNIHTTYPEFSLNTRIDTGHTENIFSVKFMPHSSDRTIVTAAGDSQVRIFDIEYAPTSMNSASNRSSRPKPESRGAGRTSSFGNHFFLARRTAVSNDITPLKATGFLDPQTRHRVYRSHTSRVKRIVTESNPHTFLTCSEDGTVRQFDLRQPSEYYARSPESGRESARRYFGSTTISEDEDEQENHPPLISYRRWRCDLNTVSCSPSQPFYIALGGANTYCFLHDRRMLGRDVVAERGGSSGDMGSATRCVRKFAPRPGIHGGYQGEAHITSCKISDAYPDNVLVSWSGDAVYMFDIKRSPEGPAMEEAEEAPGRLRNTSEPAPKRHRELQRTDDDDDDDDDDDGGGEHILSITGLVSTIKQKVTNWPAAQQSEPEERQRALDDLLITARHTYARIRTYEQHDLDCLAVATLTLTHTPELRQQRSEPARDRSRVRTWVRATGMLALALGGETHRAGDTSAFTPDLERPEVSASVAYTILELIAIFSTRGAAGVREEVTEVTASDDNDGQDVSEYLSSLEQRAHDTPTSHHPSERELIRAFAAAQDSAPTAFWSNIAPALLLSQSEPLTPNLVSHAFPHTPSPPSSPDSDSRNDPHTFLPKHTHTTLYSGHANLQTTKDVAFLGHTDEYVVSGSDDGNFFIWNTRTAALTNILHGDGDVVNVVLGHPVIPMLAVSGIDESVKIFSPDFSEQENFLRCGGGKGRGRMADSYGVIARNKQVLDGEVCARGIFALLAAATDGGGGGDGDGEDCAIS